MSLELTPFDAAEYLTDEETMVLFLEDALESGDVKVIASAIGTVARAKGMTQLAKDAGMSRESLYKALSTVGNPELATVLKVLSALGLKLSVEPNNPKLAAG